MTNPVREALAELVACDDSPAGAFNYDQMEPTLRYQSAIAAARATLAQEPAHVTPCPDGDACPDARKYGAVHPAPAADTLGKGIKGNADDLVRPVAWRWRLTAGGNNHWILVGASFHCPQGDEFEREPLYRAEAAAAIVARDRRIAELEAQLAAARACNPDIEHMNESRIKALERAEAAERRAEEMEGRYDRLTLDHQKAVERADAATERAIWAEGRLQAREADIALLEGRLAG